MRCTNYGKCYYNTVFRRIRAKVPLIRSRSEYEFHWVLAWTRSQESVSVFMSNGKASGVSGGMFLITGIVKWRFGHWKWLVCVRVWPRDCHRSGDGSGGPFSVTAGDLLANDGEPGVTP